MQNVRTVYETRELRREWVSKRKITKNRSERKLVEALDRMIKKYGCLPHKPEYASPELGYKPEEVRVET